MGWGGGGGEDLYLRGQVWAVERKGTDPANIDSVWTKIYFANSSNYAYTLHYFL